MPFRSQAQWRYMFARHPRTAREWARKTPGGYRSLPHYTGLGVAPADDTAAACIEVCENQKHQAVVLCNEKYDVATQNDQRRLCLNAAQKTYGNCVAACSQSKAKSVLAVAGAALLLLAVLR